MTLEERTIIKSINVRPDVDAIEVQWAIQILKDGEVVSERYHRSSYGRTTASAFYSEVENAGAYMAALGWNVPQT